MEKVIITEIKPVNGMRFEAVTFKDGRTGNVWDGNNGSKNLADSIRQNINLECEAELKQFTKKDGSIGYNIRAFMPSNITPVAEPVQNNVQPTAQPVVQHSIKSTSIVSQVLVKCATRIICSEAYKNIEGGLGQNLNEIINELVGTYKLSLKLINE